MGWERLCRRYLHCAAVLVTVDGLLGTRLPRFPVVGLLLFLLPASKSAPCDAAEAPGAVVGLVPCFPPFTDNDRAEEGGHLLG